MTGKTALITGVTGQDGAYLAERLGWPPMVVDVVGYRGGGIVTDTSRPDGTPCKLTSPSRLRALGCQLRIGLRDGMADAYRAFLDESERGALVGNGAAVI